MSQENASVTLYISRTEKETRTLKAAVKCFVEAFGDNLPKTYSVLYTPKNCFLAIVRDAKFYDEKGEIDPEKEAVFEARVFNETAELRWLNEANGQGKAVTVSTEEKRIFDGTDKETYVDKIDQDYLLWGRSTEKYIGDWTQFAEARIGAFFVPLKNVARGAYAKFTAVEYLSIYEDGNVAVAEERLTGLC